MKIATESFQIKELYHLTQIFFSDEDFRPSELINRPPKKFERGPTPPGETSKELQMPVPIEKKAADGSTYSNSLKNISPPEGSTANAEGARISPLNFPYRNQKHPSRGAGRLGDHR